MTHKAKAYLIVTLKVEKSSPFPTIHNVGIYSSSALGLTGVGGLVNADIVSMEGNSFSEAKTKLLEYVRIFPVWAWMLPWIEEDRAAHMSRAALWQERNLRARRGNCQWKTWIGFPPSESDYRKGKDVVLNAREKDYDF